MHFPKYDFNSDLHFGKCNFELHLHFGKCNPTSSLSNKIDTGTLRETFFFNQLQLLFDVRFPKQGDFLVDGKYIFEVGGQNKTFVQIKNIPQSYLAVDGMEVGFGNRIPLWMFGFLY